MENIVEKEENAVYQHFLLFPQCFQKAFSSTGASKVVIVWQRVNVGLHTQCMWCFNPFPNKPWFLSVCSSSRLQTLWEKEKLLVMSIFSFSHSVFFLFGELSAITIKFEIVVSKLFQFGKV